MFLSHQQKTGWKALEFPWDIQDHFTPVGSFIDKSKISDPSTLELFCEVNGVERQKGHTKETIRMNETPEKTQRKKQNIQGKKGVWRLRSIESCGSLVILFLGISRLKRFFVVVKLRRSLKCLGGHSKEKSLSLYQVSDRSDGKQ